MLWLTVKRAEWAPKTTKRRLAVLRSWGQHHGQSAFLRRYKGPRISRGAPRPLPGGEHDLARMMVEAGGREEQALVALCGLVGCRVQEAIDVMPDDLDFDAEQITVRGKGARFRVVPLSPRAITYIAPATEVALQRGTTVVPIANSTAREAISRIGTRAHLHRPISSHDLRATFATAAYERSGRNILVVMHLLGHANVETTVGYTGVEWDAMRAAVGA